MAKLIILRGNSGSGKTTIAKALQKKMGLGTMLISQDVVRREILYLKGEEIQKISDLLYILTSFGRVNCDVIILEGILRTKKYEELFKKLVKDFKGNIYSYYFDIPFEETLKRHSQRDCANEFGEKEMKTWWEEKDFSQVLSEKIIVKDMKEEDIINKIYKEVGE